ncbi:hypothetical protein C7409_1403, partial [Paraburkholderia caballeronis]
MRMGGGAQALREARAAGVAEGAEDRGGEGVACVLPFGVPLHAERERGRAGDADRFDQAIGRNGFGGEAGTEAVDALAVQRVDAGVGRAARQPLQQAAGHERDRMRRRVLEVERIGLVLAVIGEAVDGVDLLVERAAEGDVQLLEAAADGEHGDAGVDGGAQQREGGGVAVRVVQGGLARCAAVAVRFDVRIAAGEEQAVDGGEHVRDGLALAERGQHEGERVGAVGDGGEVLLAGNVRR